ncbi:hypothetical protein EYF80_003863 [Liparis tanakae]|uniref:Uncharacterized protein n=1 Tax=Liparis tanakae TaxID=230148 RepID=A0A4Z2J751_9TELE|nr:hypothetical protein EYF80_003863 [Liparis tanakae]
MSLRLAWMTSEARTELTENSSSLEDRRSKRNSLKSHTTAIARCQPFFTPVGLGTWDTRTRVQPCRMSPTIREVHWLHLVGVLKDFTTN